MTPAQRSAVAEVKAQRKHLEDGTPVQSFQALLRDLATVAKNRVQSKVAPGVVLDILTTPTSVQQRAFDLLGISPRM